MFGERLTVLEDDDRAKIGMVRREDERCMIPGDTGPMNDADIAAAEHGLYAPAGGGNVQFLSERPLDKVVRWLFVLRERYWKLE